ncbi:polymorphic toxin-type HINT domain-containing protein [Streptomyces virginiae]|uniref:polymorphic toxin-type HINT domain-containing protein n=1 Tax=Streptomyces virginiae TaxID=1961 RepID=UPI0022522E3A|nr:polymorphic toxin-type HINT domain-containing protein [Streptomyces virginiae]MCX4962403.1 polymorphic toxin-type HINT domain-containing protein [Streptomyces virginiae]
MFQHVKQKIVILLTVMCLTVGAAGTAAAVDPLDRPPTLLEIAARVSQYSKCKNLPLLERPKCAKEFALKSVKVGLALGVVLYIFQDAMEDDERPAFAEITKEVAALQKLQPENLLHPTPETDPQKRREALEQFVKTFKAAKPAVDALRTKLELAARVSGTATDSVEMLAFMTAVQFFPPGEERPPVVADGSFGRWIDDVLGALNQINRGLDETNAALDEMNGIMVDVNKSIDGMNEGLKQANRGMAQLNEGVGQMNQGMGQMNTAVAGFNKAADKILAISNIEFDFSHVADRVGAHPQSPEERAAENRRVGMVLDLLPGISSGKGVVEAITGNDLATGERLDTIDRVVGGLVVLKWLKTGGTLTAEAIRAARKTEKVAGCFNSFPAGTPVLMGDGATRPIEQIKVGDTVLAADPETGAGGPRRVDGTIYTPDDSDFTGITVGQGAGSLTATDHHPIWVENRKQWTDAADLNSGDTLRTSDGTAVAIDKVTHWKELQGAYNLTVNDLHTYYVLAGVTPVLVHNSNGLCSRPAAIAKETGLSVKQVKDAIHKVKAQGAWRGIGGNKNPDMLIDPKTGEVYPQMPDGSPGDSIGNIFDHIPGRS